MGGKKIDRKRQSLLSRAAKRKATIKKLSHKPVIKHVDVNAIKESFKNAPQTHAGEKKSKPEKIAETVNKTPVEVAKTPKPHKAPKEGTKE